MSHYVLFTDPWDATKQIIEYKSHISVIGGDGTILTAIDKFYDLKKPFFGIAGGTVNFLMNESATLLDSATELILKLIKVTVKTTKGAHTVWAFNDVAIGEFGGWIEYNCIHQDGQISTFKGSVLVVSTAQGSTGSNKNCQGPVLPLNSYNWAITNAWSNRRVNCVITPKKGLTVNCTSRGNVKVAVDGTNHEFTEVLSVIMVQESHVKVLINDIKNLQEKRQ